MNRRNTNLTKEQMMAAIKECAENLGRVPSQTEAMKMKGLTVPMIRRNFGTYNQFLGVCKMEGRKQGQKYGTEQLLLEWARVTRKLKKIPSVLAYEQLSDCSETPFSVRFGSWKRVPQAFKQYAERKGWMKDWQDVLALVDKHTQEEMDTYLDARKSQEAGIRNGATEITKGSATDIRPPRLWAGDVRVPTSLWPHQRAGSDLLVWVSSSRYGIYSDPAARGISGLRGNAPRCGREMAAGAD